MTQYNMWSPHNYIFEVDCTFCPISALRCIEVKIPYYGSRCTKGLWNRRRYFSFNRWWITRYDFDSESRYIMKKK